MVYQALIVVLATFSVIIGHAIGQVALPGLGRIKMDSVAINGIPNKYVSSASITQDPETLDLRMEAVILETLPEDLMMLLNISSNGARPAIEYSERVCTGATINQPLIENIRCPIVPGTYTVGKWNFPIERDVIPGPIRLDITLESGEMGEMGVQVIGDIVVDGT